MLNRDDVVSDMVLVIQGFPKRMGNRVLVPLVADFKNFTELQVLCVFIS
jgi:hypothetical protein